MIVSIVAPGAMGAAVAARLVSHGVTVRTLLEGRSPATVARAQQAGMQGVSLESLAEASLVLSIVPPAEALPLAERLAPVLAAAPHPPVYVDCNAVSPQTVQRIAAVLAGRGVRFVDAGIIGLPPGPTGRGPVFYASGPHAAALQGLVAHGLAVKLLDGPIGAASGLKMSYAGITKGLTGLAAAMMLAATRFGAAADLRAELAESQPGLLAAFEKSVPGMYPKAYRWVAEMEEIAAFAGDDVACRQIYEGMARLYAQLAADRAGKGTEIAALDAFLER
jgi:putative dehydrogenase